MDQNSHSVQTYDQIAALYQERFMDLTLYNETYESCCRLLETSSPSLLEIGCGPGNITRFIRSRLPESNIVAIDAAPNMIALARENVPGVDFRVMDCRKLSGIPKELDAIICGFCMPYLNMDESAKLIADCAALLKQGGIFYCSLIEGAYEKSRFQTGSNTNLGAYVFYYSEAWLKEQLVKNELLVVESKRIFFERKQVQEAHLVVIARKF